MAEPASSSCFCQSLSIIHCGAQLCGATHFVKWGILFHFLRRNEWAAPRVLLWKLTCLAHCLPVKPAAVIQILLRWSADINCVPVHTHASTIHGKKKGLKRKKVSWASWFHLGNLSIIVGWSFGHHVILRLGLVLLLRRTTAHLFS